MFSKGKGKFKRPLVTQFWVAQDSDLQAKYVNSQVYRKNLQKICKHE